MGEKVVGDDHKWQSNQELKMFAYFLSIYDFSNLNQVKGQLLASWGVLLTSFLCLVDLYSYYWFYY